MSKNLSGNEIREMFLKFFKEKHNCTIVESSSLVPDNPTVLLTTAGMLQFVPIFLGYKEAPYNPKRATSCQKCARAGGKDSDINNVGRTPRHHTFFEMLGNFSFGDYFKKEVIPWAWDFVTNYLKLDKSRLWITIYKDDNEAFDIWHNVVGVEKSRILRKGKKDNFWGPPGPTGPCGPCTEIHYDLGEQYKCSDNCSIETCECDRWVEIWNLVFMELFQDENGKLCALEKKNVDTGMGLERIAMVCQEKSSTFETDLLFPILKNVCDICGKTYGQNNDDDISIRIITDHIRCATFMVDDDILPGNEMRSYVLRMIIRRALRHGKMLGLELPFLYSLVNVVVQNYCNAYPSLLKNKSRIEKIIKNEELKFKQTLDRGEKLLKQLINSNKKIITGKEAFKLYDTFGFPLELTLEAAKDNNIEVDIDGFTKEMENQKQIAKAASQKIVLTDDLVFVDIEKKFGPTNFIGYDVNHCDDAKILAIENTNENNLIDIVLDKTPFYAQSGGQSGDIGKIINENMDLKVLNTFKVNHLFVHRCKLQSGKCVEGETVQAKIDTLRRAQIENHHTLAHLLQAALIKVLGNEVKQKGSDVDENRTRFDFSFSRAMSKEELEKTEELINSWILSRIEQNTEVLDIEKAKQLGAIGLFNEKYEKIVRVVSIGQISKELCGGTHAKNTKDLIVAKILSESAISSGIRRIEIVCCNSALMILKQNYQIIQSLEKLLKTPYEQLPEKINKLINENYILQKEIDKLKYEKVKTTFKNYIGEIDVLRTENSPGCYLLVPIIKEEMDMKALIQGFELIKSNLKSPYIVVFIANNEEKTFAYIKVDQTLTNNIEACDIIKFLSKKYSFKGGGRANQAQGSTNEKLDFKQHKNLIDELKSFVKARL